MEFVKLRNKRGWLALAALVTAMTAFVGWAGIAAAASNSVTVCVNTSGGSPTAVTGVLIRYNNGGGNHNIGYTNSSGCVAADLSDGTYSFEALYGGTSDVQSGIVVPDSTNVTFTTTTVLTTVADSDGHGISGVLVRYNPGDGNHNIGYTNSSGQVSIELFPTSSVDFQALYGGTSASHSVGIVSDPTNVTFTTTTVLTTVADSDGHGISGVLVRYNPGDGNHNIGYTNSSGQVSIELFPASSVNFQALYGGTSASHSVGIASDPTNVTFTTTTVLTTVADSDGHGISGVLVRYNPGDGNHNIGYTNSSGQVSTELFPTSGVNFQALYGGTSASHSVDIVSDPTDVTFTTTTVLTTVADCNGNPLVGVLIRYNPGDGNHNIGYTNSSGQVSTELFPASGVDFQALYGGASNTVTQAIDSDPTNVNFQATTVTIFNPGTIHYKGPDGAMRTFHGPTMTLLPAAYTFYTPETNFDLNVTGCSFTGGVVRLVDHSGNGLSGGTASYYVGGWHSLPGTTDANGNLVFSAPDSSGLYIAMSYKGKQIQQSRAELNASHYTFQTVLTTLKLVDADGNPLDTGNASFYASSWQTFGGGTTSSGEVSTELLPATYSFAMVYNHTRQQLDGQNIATNPVVTFQTGRLTVNYSEPIDWSNSQFYTFDKPTMEFLPGTISLDVDGTGTLCVDPIVIHSGDHLVKSVVVGKLLNHSGVGIAGGQASAYIGGWQPMGPTNGHGTICKVFDGTLGNVTVSMSYGGAHQQLTQSQPTNSVYTFQTANVTVELRDSSDNLLDGGTASYYASGWKSLDPCRVARSRWRCCPDTYTFAMSYNGQSQQLSNQEVNRSATTITFKTTDVKVELVDHWR